MPKQVLRIDIPEEVNYFDLISDEIEVISDGNYIKPCRLRAGLPSNRPSAPTITVGLRCEFDCCGFYTISLLHLPIADAINEPTAILTPVVGIKNKKVEMTISAAGKRYLLQWILQQEEYAIVPFFKFI